MVREISTKKYIAAAAITILIFLLGVALGIIFDYQRIKWAEESSKGQELDTKSIQLQYFLLNSLPEQDNLSACAVMKVTLEESTKNLHYSLEKIESFKKESIFNKEKYEQLQRGYMIDNIQYWTFARRARNTCKINILPILYFYSETKCDKCPDQGVVLTFFKKKFGDSLLVFPINADLREKENLVEILESYYGVDEYPTIVIKDQKFEGMIDKETLQREICSSFITPHEECA